MSTNTDGYTGVVGRKTERPVGRTDGIEMNKNNKKNKSSSSSSRTAAADALYLKNATRCLQQRVNPFDEKKFQDFSALKAFEMSDEFWESKKSRFILAGSHPAFLKSKTVRFSDTDLFTMDWNFYRELWSKSISLRNASLKNRWGYDTVHSYFKDFPNYNGRSDFICFRFDNANVILLLNTLETLSNDCSPLTLGNFICGRFLFSITAVFIAYLETAGGLVCLEASSPLLQTALPVPKEDDDLTSYPLKHVNNQGPRALLPQSLKDRTWMLLYDRCAAATATIQLKKDQEHQRQKQLAEKRKSSFVMITRSRIKELITSKRRRRRRSYCSRNCGRETRDCGCSGGPITRSQSKFFKRKCPRLRLLHL